MGERYYAYALVIKGRSPILLVESQPLSEPSRFLASTNKETMARYVNNMLPIILEDMGIQHLRDRVDLSSSMAVDISYGD